MLRLRTDSTRPLLTVVAVCRPHLLGTDWGHRIPILAIGCDDKRMFTVSSPRLHVDSASSTRLRPDSPGKSSHETSDEVVHPARSKTKNAPDNVFDKDRPQLSELDVVLSKFVDRTCILDQPLALARQLYDFVFLDTPPSAAAITTAAASASSELFLQAARLPARPGKASVPQNLACRQSGAEKGRVRPRVH